MKGNTPADIWREFVGAELKSKSKLGKMVEPAVYGGYENKVLTLYFPDDDLRKAAQGQRDSIQKKLKEQYRLVCDRINFNTGTAPATAAPVQPAQVRPATTASKTLNPLQALCWVEPNLPAEEEVSQRMRILTSTVDAERACNPIYETLKKRTLLLVGGEENAVRVSFNWRVRVGGTRGFRELLLPVLHPVFGIPYIPASTLKGAARAWAENHSPSDRVKELLGMLHGKTAKAAKVEFLDAFPTKPCLSVDVATPQWGWNNNKVMYKPEPHPLLSMEQPQVLIGLRPASGGTPEDVREVKGWLENALKTGIGSRVSGGYGRALGQVASLPHSQNFQFELWTQGMYGIDPPSKENRYTGTAEFRPSAVRGILRFWFRAVALGFYDAGDCQTLEEELFGKLGKQGKISISTLVNPSSRKDPYCYAGQICLEATERKYLRLASQLLVLASHLGGVGRGSRRPLHRLNGRMRGCHWELLEADLPWEGEAKKWQECFDQLKQAFEAVRSPVSPRTGDPGRHKQRQQDVLGRNAQVWLLKSAGQIAPNRVKDWQLEGARDSVQGAALNFLYGDDQFKGVSKGQGNPNVGGALETPSFVWIKSVFPASGSAYQVVTVFGTDHPDRLKFAEALKQQKAILVYGEMPPASGPPASPPRPRRR